jgi:hypothetical protein
MNDARLALEVEIARKKADSDVEIARKKADSEIAVNEAQVRLLMAKEYAVKMDARAVRRQKKRSIDEDDSDYYPDSDGDDEPLPKRSGSSGVKFVPLHGIPEAERAPMMNEIAKRAFVAIFLCFLPDQDAFIIYLPSKVVGSTAASGRCFDPAKFKDMCKLYNDKIHDVVIDILDVPHMKKNASKRERITDAQLRQIVSRLRVDRSFIRRIDELSA